MRTTLENKIALSIGLGLALGAMLQLEALVIAEEKKDPVDPPHTCQLRVEVRGKVPVLEKIPFIQHFFDVSSTAEVCSKVEKCPEVVSQTCAEDEFERIGVDFDILPGQMVTFMPFGGWEVACPENSCAACTAETKVAKASNESKQECVRDCDVECETKDVMVKLAKVAKHACQPAGLQCHDGHHGATCAQLATLLAEKSALESAFEAQQAIAESREEMLEMMVELAAENAKLQSQVEYGRERAEMQEKLLEVYAENAKLKAAAELADERHQLLKQSVEIAVENERLKSRVAELEQTSVSGDAGTRTAKVRASKRGSVAK